MKFLSLALMCLALPSVYAMEEKGPGGAQFVTREEQKADFVEYVPRAQYDKDMSSAKNIIRRLDERNRRLEVRMTILENKMLSMNPEEELTIWNGTNFEKVEKQVEEEKKFGLGENETDVCLVWDNDANEYLDGRIMNETKDGKRYVVTFANPKTGTKHVKKFPKDNPCLKKRKPVYLRPINRVNNAKMPASILATIMSYVGDVTELNYYYQEGLMENMLIQAGMQLENDTIPEESPLALKWGNACDQYQNLIKKRDGIWINGAIDPEANGFYEVKEDFHEVVGKLTGRKSLFELFGWNAEHIKTSFKERTNGLAWFKNPISGYYIYYDTMQWNLSDNNGLDLYALVCEEDTPCLTGWIEYNTKTELNDKGERFPAIQHIGQMGCRKSDKKLNLCRKSDKKLKFELDSKTIESADSTLPEERR